MKSLKNIQLIDTSLGKKLILQKINLNENKEMKNHIRKIFSEPEYYFNDKFKGHTIIIGKKNSKNLISKKFSPRKSIIRIKTINRQSSKIDNRKTMPKINLNLNQNNNKRIIDHYELKSIYNRFKEINEDNLKEEKNKIRLLKKKNFIDPILTEEINENLNKTIKTEIEHELNFQNNVLLNKKKEEIKINRLSKKLSKKLKRPISKLLMKQNEGYRTIKEIENFYFQEIQNSFPQENYKWIVNLRDNDNHYINEGSEKVPIWNLYINKKENKEIIRNPNIFIKTENTFFSRNDYIKNKISYKNFFTLNKNISNNISSFNNMCIKGKNLLSLEIENSKNLKGRKIVLNGNPFSNSNPFFNNGNDKNIKNEMYENNIDFKYIKKKKRAFSLMDDDLKNFV